MSRKASELTPSGHKGVRSNLADHTPATAVLVDWRSGRPGRASAGG